jgi:hypothetical protein
MRSKTFGSRAGAFSRRIASAIALAALVAGIGPSRAETTLEPDVDRPGADLSSFDVPQADPQICRQACDEQAACKAYTYVNPGAQGPQARCWLKSSVPPPVPSSCCTSGTKAKPVGAVGDIQSSTAYNDLGGKHDADIEALAFLALMQAAKSAQDDLRAIAARVKAINHMKKSAREFLQKINAPSNPCAGRAAASWRLCVRKLQRNLLRIDLAALDVMKGAAGESQDDLRGMMAALQSASQERQRGANLQARGYPPNPCKGWTVAMFKACLDTIDARLAGNLPDRESEDQARTAIDQVRQSLNDMSELGEMDSLRLQMAMERMTKMIETLSNILKKISDTASAITQNLK